MTTPADFGRERGGRGEGVGGREEMMKGGWMEERGRKQGKEVGDVYVHEYRAMGYYYSSPVSVLMSVGFGNAVVRSTLCMKPAAKK